MNTKGNTRKREMVMALEKTLGNVSESAWHLGISRETDYQWTKQD